MRDDDFESTDNPYASPEAEIHGSDAPIGKGLLTAPRTVEAARGWHWCRVGVELYRRSPGMWIVVVAAIMGINMMLGFLPGIGAVLTTLLQPVFMAGLMLGARDVAVGRQLTFGHAVAGFQRRTGALVGAGGLYFAGFLAVGFALGLLAFLIAMLAGVGLDPESADPMLFVLFVMLFALIFLAITLPLVMAIWFAPALLIFHDELGTVEAMMLSFKGCVRNALPFLIWGLALLGAGLLVAVPIVALGFAFRRFSELDSTVVMIVIALTMLPIAIVCVPLMYTSTYAAYRDVFLGEIDDRAAAETEESDLAAR